MLAPSWRPASEPARGALSAAGRDWSQVELRLVGETRPAVRWPAPDGGGALVEQLNLIAPDVPTGRVWRPCKELQIWPVDQLPRFARSTSAGLREYLCLRPFTRCSTGATTSWRTPAERRSEPTPRRKSRHSSAPLRVDLAAGELPLLIGARPLRPGEGDRGVARTPTPPLVRAPGADAYPSST